MRDVDAGGRYSIHQVAEMSGFAARLIRYYIQQGLLDPPAGRGPAAYYTTEHLQQLAMIATFREQRLTHDEMRSRLRPPAPSQPAIDGHVWQRLTLHDALELHVRADAPESIRVLARRLADDAARWLHGDADGEA